MSFYASAKTDPIDATDEKQSDLPQSRNNVTSEESEKDCDEIATNKAAALNGPIITNKLSEISSNINNEDLSNNTEQQKYDINDNETSKIDVNNKENTDTNQHDISSNNNNHHNFSHNAIPSNVSQTNEDNESVIEDINRNESGTFPANINQSDLILLNKNVSGPPPEITNVSDIISLNKNESGADDDDGGYVPVPVANDNSQSEAINNDGNQSDDATDVEDEYGFTEDQKRAMMELEMLKRELGYVETEPPEYNVKDRLAQLNADLENEPDVKKKESRVMFKENLVDLIVPPQEDSEDESKNVENKNVENKNVENKNVENKNLENKSVENKTESLPESPASIDLHKNGNTKVSISPDSPDSSDLHEDGKTKVSVSPDSNDLHKDGKTKVSVSPDSSSPKTDANNKVLIEREGKFELVHADDIKAMDLESPNSPEHHDHVTNDNTLSPRPPSEPRPQTADGLRYGSSSSGVTSRRVKSAPMRSVINESYNSPYGLTSEQKQLLMKQKDIRAKKQLEREEELRRKKDLALNESNECFLTWLSRKKEESRKRLDEERSVRSHEHVQRQPKNRQYSMSFTQMLMPEMKEDIYKDWLGKKKKQRKQEKLLKSRESMENAKCCIRKSQEEINEAYKSWLRQKAYEARKTRLLELMRNRARYLIMKRQKKMDASRRRKHKPNETYDSYKF